MDHPVIIALNVVAAMVQQQTLQFKVFPLWHRRTMFLCMSVREIFCAILNRIWTIATHIPLIFKSTCAVHRHSNSNGTTSSEPHVYPYVLKDTELV